MERLSAQVDSLYFCRMKNMILLATIIISVTSCAQLNKSIVKASAFYTVRTPGTIPVDDAGQPLAMQLNKVYNLFLEVKDSSLEWIKAWTGDKVFNLIPIAVKGRSAVIGKKRAGGKEIVMTAGEGNFLVQLELSPNNTYQKAPQALKQDDVLLQGKWKGKPFYYKIPTVTELASPEYQ